MIGTGSGIGGESSDSCDIGDDDLANKGCDGFGFSAAMAIIFSIVSLGGVYISYTGSYNPGSSSDFGPSEGEGDDYNPEYGDHQSEEYPNPNPSPKSPGSQSNFVSV